MREKTAAITHSPVQYWGMPFDSGSKMSSRSRAQGLVPSSRFQIRHRPPLPGRRTLWISARASSCANQWKPCTEAESQHAS